MIKMLKICEKNKKKRDEYTIYYWILTFLLRKIDKNNNKNERNGRKIEFLDGRCIIYCPYETDFR